MHLGLAAEAGPSWRLPVLVVVGVVLLAAAAMAIALSEISDDAGSASRAPAPAGVAGASRSETAERRTPRARGERARTPRGGGAGGRASGRVAGWPEGTSAYTVVVIQSESRARARARALEVAEAGLAAGVLDSDDYSSLTPGRWIAFAGQFDTSREARDAAERYAALGFRGGRAAFVNAGE